MPRDFECIEFTSEQFEAVMSRNSGQHKIRPWLATNGKYYLAEVAATDLRQAEEIRSYIQSLPRVMKSSVTIYRATDEE